MSYQSPTRVPSPNSPAISSSAWDVIEAVLRPKAPHPSRESWELVAEQERLLISDILRHRLTVMGG